MLYEGWYLIMKYKCDRCGKPTENSYRDSDYKNGEYIGKYGNREHHFCDNCIRKFRNKYDWNNEEFKTNCIVCPWCGFDQDNSKSYEKDEKDVECEYCFKLFDLEINYETTYTTKRAASQYEIYLNQNKIKMNPAEKFKKRGLSRVQYIKKEDSPACNVKLDVFVTLKGELIYGNKKTTIKGRSKRSD